MHPPSARLWKVNRPGAGDPSSTTIYAKVNLAALREVAALDLEGLV
jgi:hypothetical protein